ncbi:TPA: M48 family metalloprotease [Photobacterium damselae]
MFRLKKAPVYTLITSLLLGSVPNIALASNSIMLPDMGTTAASTLTIDKELEYGDAYMRMLRSSKPIINDPVLTEYVQDLGHKLVANASDVRTPFTFFLIRDKEINAFAFFGGHVAIHSGLFLYAQNESELASVLAHEIAHVTQRHLARSMEEQAKRSPATMAALVGSLMLAIASPEAGIAAMQATTAASMQGQINYTRSNEKEADRIGIATLAKAGFDPKAMPRFFERLADQYRYVSKPPQMLLTHPLPESRITDSRQRASQYPTVRLPPSENYLLARSRIVARYANFSENAALAWFGHQLKKFPSQRKELNYGKALVYIDNGKYKEANGLLTPLLAAEPNNPFYIDAMTDLDLYQQKFTPAIQRLKTAIEQNPDSTVLRLNYINVLQEQGKYQQTIPLLVRYTYDQPDDINGWSMLAKAFAKTRQRPSELAALAEIYALRAQWDKAITNYMQASQLAPLNSMDQARFDARIDQLRRAKMTFDNLKN